MNIKKNYSYHLSYQLIVFLLPMLTVPYTARVFGASGIGAYVYTNTIAEYFVLLGKLGIATYGNRQVAMAGENINSRNLVFSEVYAIQLLSTIFASVLYFISIFFIGSQYPELALMQGLLVLAAVFDVTWLFFGVGDFKTTAIRNISVRLLSVVMIFTLVKGPEDLWLYTLIKTMSVLLGQASLWIILRRRVRLVRVSLSSLFKHLKPILLFFVPVLSVSVIRYTDKILLGGTSGVADVGLFYNSQLMLDIPRCMVTSLCTVMMPFMSLLLSKNDRAAHRSYFHKGMFVISVLSVAVVAGSAAIAPELSIIFLGDDFARCALFMLLLCPGEVLFSWNYALRSLYTLPMLREKIYISAAVSGVCVNLTINFLLIPKLGVIGAIIGSLASELLITLIMTISVWREIQLKKLLLRYLPILAAALAMYGTVRLIGQTLGVRLITIVVQVPVGAVLYFLIVGGFFILTKDQTAMELIGMLKARLRRRMDKSQTT